MFGHFTWRDHEQGFASPDALVKVAVEAAFMNRQRLGSERTRKCSTLTDRVHRKRRAVIVCPSSCRHLRTFERFEQFRGVDSVARGEVQGQVLPSSGKRRQRWVCEPIVRVSWSMLVLQDA